MAAPTEADRKRTAKYAQEIVEWWASATPEQQLTRARRELVVAQAFLEVQNLRKAATRVSETRVPRLSEKRPFGRSSEEFSQALRELDELLER